MRHALLRHLARTIAAGALLFRAAPLAAQAVPVSAPAAAAARADSASPVAALLAAGVPDTGARAVSLEDALRLAQSKSEAVRVARAGADRARGNQIQARSALLPQLYGSLGYQKTLKSQFSALANSAPVDNRPVCQAFTPQSGGTTDARLDSLERALALTSNCQAQSSGGIDFSKVGFGARNQYSLGLSGSQTLFAGGRVLSQVQAAGAAGRAADLELRAQRAQSILDVTQAYYDAALAQRLVTIAESSLVQTETVLRQTSLARQVGNTSEFDYLRARVTRDNQIPLVIQQRAQRDLAVLRLKQLLELPLAEGVRLTTELGDTTEVPIARAASFAVSAVPDTTAEDRAAVRQANEAVKAQEALLRAARGERLPSISLVSQYGRVAYPQSGVPDWSSFVTNWTVGVQLQVPLFVGGRLHGDALVAQANLDEAKARRDQAREYAALDALTALTQLRQAEASWQASAGTAEQASRAYSIAELRYREGISTQTELSESRLLLQQSAANRAMAARNLQLARVKLALLKDLPLQSSGSAAQQGAQQQQQQMQQQQQQQGQQQSQQGAASAAQGATTSQTGQAGGFAP